MVNCYSVCTKVFIGNELISQTNEFIFQEEKNTKDFQIECDWKELFEIEEDVCNRGGRPMVVIHRKGDFFEIIQPKGYKKFCEKDFRNKKIKFAVAFTRAWTTLSAAFDESQWNREAKKFLRERGINLNRIIK